MANVAGLRAHRRWIAVAALIAAVGACSSGNGGTAQDAGGTAQDAGGEGAAGGGGPAGSACDQFLACTAAAEPGSLSAALAAYGADGACWTQFDRATCDDACAKATRALHQVYPDEPSCPECVGDADCAGACKAGRCVQCGSDADCGAPTPRCDVASSTCVACTADVDCGGSARCSPGHTCVQCLTDTDCAGSTPACSANQCVGCTSNAQCSGTRPLCDMAQAVCVTCLTGSDCATGACSQSHQCCTPPSCAQVFSDGRVACGATHNASGCGTATLDCGSCAVGACSANFDGYCTSAGAPCTPGSASGCAPGEQCIADGSTGVCGLDESGQSCGGVGQYCASHAFICAAASSTDAPRCLQLCASNADCLHAGQTCHTVGYSKVCE